MVRMEWAVVLVSVNRRRHPKVWLRACRLKLKLHMRVNLDLRRLNCVSHSIITVQSDTGTALIIVIHSLISRLEKVQ